MSAAGAIPSGVRSSRTLVSVPARGGQPRLPEDGQMRRHGSSRPGCRPSSCTPSSPASPSRSSPLLLAGVTGAYALGLDAWFVAAVPEGQRGGAMTLMTAA
ncbi:hypothetical protein [Streptomyces sp. QHH-9511]|uniref:hypothetical protein n=1 Tax=Streptomyces sp. QHH-9511 TaxID=2684468 RepID=UPI0018E09A8D|nr:hypothetical protein [Streptomyces sp. QHH-9511]